MAKESYISGHVHYLSTVELSYKLLLEEREEIAYVFYVHVFLRWGTKWKLLITEL